MLKNSTNTSNLSLKLLLTYNSEPAYISYRPESPRAKRHRIEKNVFGRKFPS